MRGERGMTVIEVVIASLLVVISGLAILGVMDTAARTGFRAEQSQIVNDRLQLEVEQVSQLPYPKMALTAAPATSPSLDDPAHRVSGTSFALARDGSNTRSLAYNGGAIPQSGGSVSGGTVAPGGPSDPSAHFESGGIKGTIYRYVTWDTHPSCPAPAAPCMKRVIVAIKLDSTASGGTRRYQELQSQVFDPSAKRSGTGSPGGGSSVPWTFWLTDTACNYPSRQPIAVTGSTDGHATHNTRATCGAANSGPRTGSNAGPPDLMYTQAPPLDSAYPPDGQPLYDYSTDVEPNTPPTDTDKGLQVLNSGNCTLLGSLLTSIPTLGNLLDGTNYQKVHKWLTKPIPSGFSNIVFTGSATLNLWTKTINGGSYPGGICVSLFTRHLNVLNIPVDLPIVNVPGGLSYVSKSVNPWPSNGWTEISVDIPVTAGLSLPIGYQLGLAISVDSGNTGGGLQFAYDAPSYDSRVQIQTTGSLPF